MTVPAGVAGRPIGHSLSPLIHGAWIAASGLDATYAAFEPSDEAAFAALIQEARKGSLRGLNVTAPFKTLALELSDDLSTAAARCGSANLLVIEGGRVRADSTDGDGLLAALDEQAPMLRLDGAKVLMLGAGGAARAAAAALKTAGAEVAVMNRTRERAETLADELGLTVADAGTVGEASLVVNALSVAPELDLAGLRPDAVLMDMTYRPLITPFLAAGQARGLTTVDGLAMLIGQARPSFTALFGVEPPDVDVRRLALTAMGEAG